MASRAAHAPSGQWPAADSRDARDVAKSTSIMRLMEILKDHDSQLQRLRVQHEALRVEGQTLRRCLQGAGVVSTESFERELRNTKTMDLSDGGASVHGAHEHMSVEVLGSSRSGSASTSRSSVRPSSNSGVGVVRANFQQSSSATRSAAVRASRSAVTSNSSTASTSASSTSGPRRHPSAENALGRAQDSTSRHHVVGVQARSSVPTGVKRVSSLDSCLPGPRHEPDIVRRRADSTSPSRRSHRVVAAWQDADLFELAKPLLAPLSRFSSCKQSDKLGSVGVATGEQVNAELALATVEKALRAGMSPDTWSGPDTPLRGAVQGHSVELTSVLLQARANPSESDTKGVSVLHVAAFDGQTELCKILLEAKADPNISDRHRQTPLFFAPARSICEVLHQARADVNAMNQKGQSALHLAGRAGISDVLSWLAARVSKAVLELRDMHGATAAYYARHAGVQPELLIKNKLLTFEPPPPALGRSALSEQSLKQRPSEHVSPQRRRSQRAHESPAGWLSSSLAASCGGRLPPLPEVCQLSDAEDIDSTIEKQCTDREVEQIYGIRDGRISKDALQQCTVDECVRRSDDACKLVDPWAPETCLAQSLQRENVQQNALEKTPDKCNKMEAHEMTHAAVRIQAIVRGYQLRASMPLAPSCAVHAHQCDLPTRPRSGSFPVGMEPPIIAGVRSNQKVAASLKIQANWRRHMRRKKMMQVPAVPRDVDVDQCLHSEDLVTWEEEGEEEVQQAEHSSCDRDSEQLDRAASESDGSTSKSSEPLVGTSTSSEDLASPPVSARKWRQRQRLSRSSTNRNYLYHIGTAADEEEILNDGQHMGSISPAGDEMQIVKKQSSVFEAFFLQG